MNQQQLQIARAALWHQNAAPLLTLDDAAAWLEETGLCLFLPRHAQLPAPAPSLVEATMGAPGIAPSAGAIATAMELAARLIDAGRAIPLNLLGTFSEQPDFLITPEVLPWVAAVRGDRQWKAAPGNRAAPIVVRTWEALEQQSAQTAVEIREVLGRELTEAAVQRALIELWTSLRALPVYTPGEPTRWSLVRDRYAAQLATGANTAQPTALSALLSLYLRSAVAATAEEAEIFLSPLTARSRIREVLHGMTAARQFATMSVASQTLLFLEGSLPETAPEAEPEAAPGASEPSPVRPARAFLPAQRRSQGGFPSQPRSEERTGRPRNARPPRREFRPAARARDAGSRDAAARGDAPRREGQPSRPFDRKRSWQQRDKKIPARFPRTQGERAGIPRPAQEDSRGTRPDKRGVKPWQRRGNGEFRSENREGRRPFPPRDNPTEHPRTERPRGEGRPWQQKNRPAGARRPEKQSQRGARPPFQRRDRPSGQARGDERGPSEFRPRRDFGGKIFDRSRSGDRPQRGKGFGEGRSARPVAGRAAKEFPGKARPFDAAQGGEGKPRSGKPAFNGPQGRRGPGKFGAGKFGAGKFGTRKSGPAKFGPKKFGSAKFGPARGTPEGPRKAPSGPLGRGEFRPGPGPGKTFRAPKARGEQKPRKNRSQDEKPE